MTTPATAYRRLVATGELEADPAQQPAVDEFDRLHEDLVAAAARERSLAGRLRRFFRRPEPFVQGIYLVGGVGRGKTLLMDLFFRGLPLEAKRRLHFHRFMSLVHAELRALKEKENPLELVAERIATDSRIICFDEFAVSDIADAMILGNLFTALFARRVTLVATSNVAPDELYRDGLQRQRFLPAIETLKAHTVLVPLDGDRDYRLSHLENAPVYLTPADAAAARQLDRVFTAIASGPGERDGTVEILGRPIPFVRRADGVLWLDFPAICDGPRSQEDYIEVAREFHTVIVAHVPELTAELDNQARRFIALVDEFYDRRVKLILSAATPLDSLYSGQRLAFPFERTRSRLTEMQGHDYLATGHRP